MRARARGEQSAYRGASLRAPACEQTEPAAAAAACLFCTFARATRTCAADRGARATWGRAGRPEVDRWPRLRLLFAPSRPAARADGICCQLTLGVALQMGAGRNESAGPNPFEAAQEAGRFLQLQAVGLLALIAFIHRPGPLSKRAPLVVLSFSSQFVLLALRAPSSARARWLAHLFAPAAC